MTTVKNKHSFTIKEVSKILSTPTGTIRQWEKDLNGLLVIPRTKQGARYYTEKEINLLQKIKEMRDKNVGKEMIRLLLEKYLHSGIIGDDFPFPQLPNQTMEPMQESTINSAEQFQEMMKTFKDDIIQELKEEIRMNQSDTVTDMKKELSATSLHTIRELSKSIHRANDKRKGELQVIADSIHQSSKKTSLEFDTLHEHLWKSSQSTTENVNRKVDETLRQATKESRIAVKKANQTIANTAVEIQEMKNTMLEDREQLRHTLSDLQKSMMEIEQRESAFQDLLHNFREAAPAKGKKKRWKWWSKD